MGLCAIKLWVQCDVLFLVLFKNLQGLMMKTNKLQINHIIFIFIHDEE